MKTIEHFVGGKSFSGDSKRTGKVFNPATGEQSSDSVTPEYVVLNMNTFSHNGERSDRQTTSGSNIERGDSVHLEDGSMYFIEYYFDSCEFFRNNNFIKWIRCINNRFIEKYIRDLNFITF